MNLSKNQSIERLAPYYFTFEYWKAGSLMEFGIRNRTCLIEEKRFTINKYAIGFIRGEKLWVRPKNDAIAVMFWFNEKHFWTHLTINEFNICFPGLEI